MACPYFEPQQVASPATHLNARLPLIEEYDGVCQATPVSFAVAGDHRFRLCNQGNVQGACPHFPATDSATSMRYQVLTSDSLHLEVLVVEEKKYSPHTWNRVQWQIATGVFTPAVANTVVNAQLLAFCRSYLRRFCGVE